MEHFHQTTILCEIFTNLQAPKAQIPSMATLLYKTLELRPPPSGVMLTMLASFRLASFSVSPEKREFSEHSAVMASQSPSFNKQTHQRRVPGCQRAMGRLAACRNTHLPSYHGIRLRREIRRSRKLKAPKTRFSHLGRDHGNRRRSDSSTCRHDFCLPLNSTRFPND